MVESTTTTKNINLNVFYFFFNTYFVFSFLKYFIYLFLHRGEGREKETKRNINVWLPLAFPLPGTWPTTQACVLTGNQTHDPLVCRLVLNTLSHTSHGCFLLLFISCVVWGTLLLTWLFGGWLDDTCPH